MTKRFNLRTPALLLVIALMSAILGAVPLAAHATSAVAWTLPTPGSFEGVWYMIAHSNGDVTYVQCDSGFTATTVAKNGLSTWNVDMTSPKYDCGYIGLVAGKYSNAYYTTVINAVGDNVVLSLQRDAIKWDTSIFSTCDPGSSVSIYNIVPGYDGYVYIFAEQAATASCPQQQRLIKLDYATGNILFNRSLGTTPNTNGYSGAYLGGLIYATATTVRRISYAGVTTANYSLPDAHKHFTAASNSPDGRFYAALETDTGSDLPECDYWAEVTDVVAVQGSREAWRTPIASPCEWALGSAASPDGGVVTYMSSGYLAPEFLVKYDARGGLSWRHDPPAGVAYADLSVDAAGNSISSTRPVYGGDPFAGAEVVSPSGSTLESFTTEDLDSEADRRMTANMTVIADGRIYLDTSGYDPVNDSLTDVKLLAINTGAVADEFGQSALAARGEGLNFVSLGDSFSSGEGAFDYLAGTDDSPYQCHRSEHAYPLLLDQELSPSYNIQKFVACSGAQTPDVYQVGQHGGSMPPQIYPIMALTAPIDVATISIGGNDVGFVPFVLACVITTCAQGSTVYNNSIDSIENDLPAALALTFSQVDSALEHRARVYVVGYPQLLPAYDEDYPESAPSCGVFSSGEVIAGRKLVDRLNEAIEAAVLAGPSRFEFVNPNYSGSPFSGHDLCAENPDFNNPDPTNMIVETFHPNQAGHVAYKDVLLGFL